MKTRNNYDYENISEHHLYQVWFSQKNRCSEKVSFLTKNYGSRGIKMSLEFRKDFKLWYYYVMSLENAAKEGYSIDRINVNRGYERGNMRWATHHMQAVNKRMYQSNTSGFIGVSKAFRSEKWRSSIRVNGKVYYLGQYETKYDAVDARNKFIINNGLKEYKIQTY